MTAFEEAWAIAKDFYFGTDHASTPGGFQTRNGLLASLMSPSNKVRPKSSVSGDGKYWAATNLSHPAYQYEDWLEDEPTQQLSEDESIRRIISTLVHEEGHEAITDPLETEAHEDFFNSKEGDPYGRYPSRGLSYSRDFHPSKNVRERGAMLIEGLTPEQIHEEMSRRGFFG